MDPEKVGILGIEIYFPKTYVSQEELEQRDGVPGKYTIGLGQDAMGFCSDREDITSICKTVLHNLLTKYNVDLNSVGRLEVGTETIIDKSKSVKSSLMEVFEEVGNYSLEGADTTNACFGGTQALFNAINWVESSSWDGRCAIVVMGDIAVYSPDGGARCTGGAGAIALLIGPNASLVFERGHRAVHFRHVYDFYKPQMSSEYPVVDGKLSIVSYISTLDACYQLYQEKCKKCTRLAIGGGDSVSLDSFDSVLFHCPFSKLVQKSFARLSFLDYRNKGSGNNILQCIQTGNDTEMISLSTLNKYSTVPLAETIVNKELEKATVTWSNAEFTKKTKPSLLYAKNVGNMYTPSLYGCLASYLISKPLEKLANNRVALFSYGSGLAGAFFSLKVSSEPTESLKLIRATLMEAFSRLEHRTQSSPHEFDAALSLRENLLKASGIYTPSGGIDLFPGTYYLESIDDKYRRKYGRVDSEHFNGSA